MECMRQAAQPGGDRAGLRMAVGLTIRDGFGQTETTALIGTPRVARQAWIDGPAVALKDSGGDRRSDTGGAGRRGEIYLRGWRGRPVNLMTGYLGDPERNDAVIAGGYYHTGDVASRDSDGYITSIGRTDDVFWASDYKISPFELESVLIEHPAVAEAAVVPFPDDLRLAVPRPTSAWRPAVLPTGPADAIFAHARENSAPTNASGESEFFDLPKTISGKIRQVELRNRENTAPVAAR